MNFDDDQIKVIEAEPVPQLVIAGPGSGKTAVLTHRIRYLNEHFKIPLDKILVITFTRAAALQMKSRFSDLCKDSNLRLDKLTGYALEIYPKLAKNLMDHIEKGEELCTYFDHDFDPHDESIPILSYEEELDYVPEKIS